MNRIALALNTLVLGVLVAAAFLFERDGLGRMVFSILVFLLFEVCLVLGLLRSETTSGAD